MITKVRMFCYNRFILVDEDQVKKHIKKDALVKKGAALSSIQRKGNLDIAEIVFINSELEEVGRKIRALNRTIRQNVQSA
jgi:hypothetical protein